MIRQKKYSICLLPAIFGLIILSCKNDKTPSLETLPIIATYSLDVPEPSGLSFFTNGRLITVSDQSGKAYVITANGTVEDILDFNGTDLEGVSFALADSILYYVDESSGKLYGRTFDNELISSQFIVSGNNVGLEGCAYSSELNMVFLVKEKEPGNLITVNLGSQNISSVQLDFADDYSGICYASSDSTLWILSHQSKTLNKCSLNGSLISQFHLSINKAEGIALNEEAGVFYIVSDSEEELYVLGIP